MRSIPNYIIGLALLLSACAAPPPLESVAPTPRRTSGVPHPHTPSPTNAPTPTPTLEPTATAIPVPPKVLIISIDGLRPDGLLAADAPNIFALAQRGSYTWDAQTIYPPVSLPSTPPSFSALPP